MKRFSIIVTAHPKTKILGSNEVSIAIAPLNGSYTFTTYHLPQDEAVELLDKLNKAFAELEK